MFAPMAKLEDEAELGQRDGKQDICSNRQKGEASWIGGKVEKKDICSNRQKRQAS